MSSSRSYIIAFALLSVSAIATAQEATPAAGQRIYPEGRRQSTRIFGAADFWYHTASSGNSAASVTRHAFANIVTAGADFGDLGFSINLPWVWQSLNTTVLGVSNTTSGAALGNFTLNGFYDIQLASGELRLGARFGLPTLNLGPMSTAEALAVGNAMFMNGLYQLQYWNNKRFTPGINATYMHNNDIYIGRGSVHLDLALATDSSVGDPVFSMQMAYSGAVRIARVVDVGARFTAVFPLTPNVDAQLAVEPFVGTDPALDLPFFARLGLVIPLDEPAGFAFDSGKYWGLHLTVGTNIDL